MLKMGYGLKGIYVVILVNGRFTNLNLIEQIMFFMK